jgi:D-alanine--poly(phosphoribitol) ligase subunit 1
MGYRIELEEIEHALVKLEPVDQAAVIYRRTNTAYGKLVAFAACAEGVDGELLLQGLEELLPDYMIPQEMVVMGELPKNPNGKVDRKKLRESLQ